VAWCVAAAPLARLPRLMGRGCALEVLPRADDIPGDIVELHGYIDRAVPDAELDVFVGALAERISLFDKQASVEIERLADNADLPPDSEIAPEWDAFMASLTWPPTQARIKTLMGGFHKPGDVETRPGYHVGHLGR
jgi:enoyl-CoA hydratase/carnithine racemase